MCVCNGSGCSMRSCRANGFDKGFDDVDTVKQNSLLNGRGLLITAAAAAPLQRPRLLRFSYAYRVCYTEIHTLRFKSGCYFINPKMFTYNSKR